MVCVLVTAGGWGDLWAFKTRNEAYMSPLYQYGDALLVTPQHVQDQYNWLEWSRLREMAGLPYVAQTARSPRHARMLKESQAQEILDRLAKLAQPAPTDPAEICRRIVQDRRRLGTVAKKKADAPAAPAETQATAATGGSAVPAPRGPKDVGQDWTISFGVDKDGNSYGPEVNNPKKEGSKTRTRFALYREGMTIAQALDAGITTADLVYDRDHKYVVFHKPGEEAVAEDNGGYGEEDAEEEIAEEAAE